jgi:hypothetical protein
MYQGFKQAYHDGCGRMILSSSSTYKLKQTIESLPKTNLCKLSTKKNS